jgi:hypothetical protein
MQMVTGCDHQPTTFYRPVPINLPVNSSFDTLPAFSISKGPHMTDAAILEITGGEWGFERRVQYTAKCFSFNRPKPLNAAHRLHHKWHYMFYLVHYF